MAHPEKLKGFTSQTTKLTLGKMINMFATLDALKNMKACLSNDYSFFKRANGFLQSGTTLDPTEIIEEREIGFFLATQRSIETKSVAGSAGRLCSRGGVVMGGVVISLVPSPKFRSTPHPVCVRMGLGRRLGGDEAMKEGE